MESRDHKKTWMKNNLILIAVLAGLLLPASIIWSSTDIGNGFCLHGVVVPTSKERGIVSTVDRNGKNIVLVWLMDHRGCYELLEIDAATGKTKEFPVLFPPNHDAPYASILSSQNRYYAHFNSHFVEFDVQKEKFTLVHKTFPKTAMSMTEDDNGVIWSVTYPHCGLVSYDPHTGVFKDYGQVYDQNWSQYPRYIAADDKGWIYIAIGKTASQIIAFDPSTGSALPMISEHNRKWGQAYLYRDLNGKVYGKCLMGPSHGWLEFYEGKSKRIGRHSAINKKSYIAGPQSLFHRKFPNGERIKALDLMNRRLVIEKNRRETMVLRFNYSTEGSLIISVGVSPDGTIYGGTYMSAHFFRYDPNSDRLWNRPCYGQWNTLASQNKKCFIGGYPRGFLLEWDPFQSWIPTKRNNSACNPTFRCEGSPEVYRPHKILPHLDGKTIILAGTPDYGRTGGGLMFWDRKTQTVELLKHTQIVPYQATKSLVSLSSDLILGGTTTAPGTGGVRKAKQAELYIMSVSTKKVLWHQPVLPNVDEYTDLCMGRNGLAYGIADRKVFFVFDVDRRKIICQKRIPGQIPYQQGPRVFIRGPSCVYMLLSDRIARIDPETHKILTIATSPVPITAGGAFLRGRIYFGSGSRLYSYHVAR